MNVFFNDNAVEIEGIQYPACWTETVTETTETEDGTVETEAKRLKTEFDGYPKRPDICGTYQGKTVYYLAMDSEREADQLQAIKDAGAYLCSSYEQMALIDMDLYRGVMECYDAEGSRIKLKDYTGDIDQMRIYAPVKVAGVEVQDKPDGPQEQFPTVVDRMSQAELYLRGLKEAVKAKAMSYIKAHPDCNLVDLLQTITGTEGEMLVILMPYYINGAAQAGFIPEATFSAFRDWVVNTADEVLMSI